MRRLGFEQRGTMFWHQAEYPVQRGLSLQRHLADERFKVNPTVAVTNPFIRGAEPEVVILANLRPDGVYLHVNADSWWPPDTALSGIAAFARHGPMWFDRQADLSRLILLVEEAIEKRLQLIDLIEPLPSELTRAPWREESDYTTGVDRPVAPYHLYLSSILHYYRGEVGMAVRRTRDWMATLDRNDARGHERAAEQLARLTDS